MSQFHPEVRLVAQFNTGVWAVTISTPFSFLFQLIHFTWLLETVPFPPRSPWRVWGNSNKFSLINFQTFNSCSFWEFPEATCSAVLRGNNLIKVTRFPETCFDRQTICFRIIKYLLQVAKGRHGNVRRKTSRRPRRDVLFGFTGETWRRINPTEESITLYSFRAFPRLSDFPLLGLVFFWHRLLMFAFKQVAGITVVFIGSCDATRITNYDPSVATSEEVALCRKAEAAEKAAVRWLVMVLNSWEDF